MIHAVYDKSDLLSIGYGLQSHLRYLNSYSYGKASLNKLVWSDYHDFPIANVPEEWIDDLISALGCIPENLTVQLGKCLNNYLGNDHYHKIGHQLVIVIGEKEGFHSPKGPACITIGSSVNEARVGESYYFPTNVPHNFRGEFYFINIQNPPLQCDGNDDYYEVA